MKNPKWVFSQLAGRLRSEQLLRDQFAEATLLLSLGAFILGLARDAQASAPLKVQSKSIQTIETSAGQTSLEDLARFQGPVWGFDFISPTLVVLTVRDGSLHQLNLASGEAIEIKGAPRVFRSGQGGLLDVVVHPDFSINRRLDLSYAKDLGNGLATTATGFGRLEGSELKGFSEVFAASPGTKNSIHFGSRLAWDWDRRLWMTMGDRGERDLAQDPKAHPGKVLRFVNGAVSIVSIGHRNPQGIFVDMSRKQVWVIEHGPRGGDEINLIQEGANYGWPVVSFGREYWGPRIGEGTEKAGMISPWYHFTPSIAPAGLVRLKGSAFPSWDGSFLTGSLVLTHLNRLSVGSGDKPGTEERLLRSLKERVRMVRQGPDGLIYLSTDSGRFMRLKPSSKDPEKK
jgi:glucose/arabinose dehydrogenase